MNNLKNWFYIFTSKKKIIVSTIKNIWKKTFLGKLLDTDPLFGKVLSALLFVYVCIHVFRLELYPMYMFAMFSKKETPRDLYNVYKVYNQDEVVDLTNWDYRKYTVFMNTVGQYDDIIENNMHHPETKAIDKFMDRLRLNGTAFKASMKSSFHFSKPELDKKIGLWLGKQLSTAPEHIRIEKESYRWDQPLPSYTQKAVVYEMDK